MKGSGDVFVVATAGNWSWFNCFESNPNPNQPLWQMCSIILHNLLLSYSIFDSSINPPFRLSLIFFPFVSRARGPEGPTGRGARARGCGVREGEGGAGRRIHTTITTVQ
uniref:Uncharacterized protein n=1 Tax=Opuntia streptacantha TaxID=393608 RepID=A0A7C9DFI2_OPUST